VSISGARGEACLKRDIDREIEIEIEIEHERQTPSHIAGTTTMRTFDRLSKGPRD
jgi:hypothetical protein